jgi:hypothetical protein
MARNNKATRRLVHTYTVLVCGGRGYRDREKVFWALNTVKVAVDKNKGKMRVIEGGATGADFFARLWRRDNRIDGKTYRARWKRFGLSAGPLRNQQMLDEEDVDIVLAFPGNEGTADMIERANAQGYVVHEFKGLPN